MNGATLCPAARNLADYAANPLPPSLYTTEFDDPLDCQRSAAPWLVLRLHVGREVWVRGELSARGIENYLPAHSSERRYGRNAPQSFERALFPGYCFVRQFQSTHDYCLALSTPNVHGLLQFTKGIAELVEHGEVERIRVMSSMRAVESWELLKEEQKVEIREGPLRGTVGVLAQRAGAYWLVKNVWMFGRAMAVKVEPRWLRAA